MNKFISELNQPSFEEFLSAYNLSNEYCSSGYQIQSRARYVNTKIGLSIVYEQGYFSVYLDDLEDSFYRLGIIVAACRNKNIEEEYKRAVETKKLKPMIVFIDKYYSEALISGEFFFQQEYKFIELRWRKMLEKVYQLPKHHPIYQKFSNDDPTWKEDIEQLPD